MTARMIKPSVFIIDVDGVMTDGRYYYTEHGKVMKVFGPDDHDALSLLKPHLEIRFVSGDKRGFPITRARIQQDMKYPLDLVSTIARIEWIKERWKCEDVVYMGDGLFDPYVFREVGYSIAPSNADEFVKSIACYTTKRAGGDRAVSEACLHLLDRFFEPFARDHLPDYISEVSGIWSVAHPAARQSQPVKRKPSRRKAGKKAFGESGKRRLKRLK